MKTNTKSRISAALVGVLLELGSPWAVAQTPEARNADGVSFAQSQETAPFSCWILMRDRAHPDHPGRWLTGTNCEGPKTPLAIRAHHAGVEPQLLIQAGEHLIVEDHSPVAEARFQAIALEKAHLGESFRVRLAVVGGATVRAILISNQRAVLTSLEGEDR